MEKRKRKLPFFVEFSWLKQNKTLL